MFISRLDFIGIIAASFFLGAVSELFNIKRMNVFLVKEEAVVTEKVILSGPYNRFIIFRLKCGKERRFRVDLDVFDNMDVGDQGDLYRRLSFFAGWSKRK